MKALFYRSLFVLTSCLVYRLQGRLGLGYWIPGSWEGAVTFVGMIAFSVSVTCGIFLTAKPTIAFVGHHWRLALSSVAIVIVGTALMYFWPKHVVKPQIEVIQPSPSPIPETSVSVPLDELDQVPPKKKDQNAIKPPPGYVLDSKTK